MSWAFTQGIDKREERGKNIDTNLEYHSAQLRR